MRPLRIAVAEDEFLLVEHLCGLVETFGHTVVGVARTGEELVTVVADEHPDLALVDIRLARGIDGLVAAKAVGERFGVPAVAVTGHLTVEEARAAGLLGLLPKPFSAAQLEATLAATAGDAAHAGLHRRQESQR
jgi:two-component system, response regulator PdtaR